MLGQQKEKKGQWEGKENNEQEQDRRVKKLENKSERKERWP